MYKMSTIFARLKHGSSPRVRSFSRAEENARLAAATCGVGLVLAQDDVEPAGAYADCFFDFFGPHVSQGLRR